MSCPPEPIGTDFLGCASQYAPNATVAQGQPLTRTGSCAYSGSVNPFLASRPEEQLSMGSALRDKTVLIIGRGSKIARAVTLLARSEGARVVVAGRDRTKLADAYADLGDSGISAEVVDITDDASIAALADRVGSVDHVVSTASAR